MNSFLCTKCGLATDGIPAPGTTMCGSCAWPADEPVNVAVERGEWRTCTDLMKGLFATLEPRGLILLNHDATKTIGQPFKLERVDGITPEMAADCAMGNYAAEQVAKEMDFFNTGPQRQAERVQPENTLTVSNAGQNGQGVNIIQPDGSLLNLKPGETAMCVKVVTIPVELLPSLLSVDTAKERAAGRDILMTGMPADAKIVGVELDWFNERIKLKIMSASFAAVTAGAQIPELEIKCERRDIEKPVPEAEFCRIGVDPAVRPDPRYIDAELRMPQLSPSAKAKLKTACDATSHAGTMAEDVVAKPDYSRFTDRSRKVMQLANQEAQRFNHAKIGTEHMLLALVKEGNGVASTVLKNLDIDLRKVRLEIEKRVPVGMSEVVTGRLPRRKDVQEAIDRAIVEAGKLGNDYVGTEHLLLGLIRCPGGNFATSILEEFDPLMVRKILHDMMLLGFDVWAHGNIAGEPAKPQYRDEADKARHEAILNRSPNYIDEAEERLRAVMASGDAVSPLTNLARVVEAAEVADAAMMEHLKRAWEPSELTRIADAWEASPAGLAAKAQWAKEHREMTARIAAGDMGGIELTPEQAEGTRKLVAMLKEKDARCACGSCADCLTARAESGDQPDKPTIR